MKLSIILSQLSTGMAGTISIFVLTLVFSLPLGLLIAFGRMSKNRIVSGIFRLYISLMRGTPLMLQLMVVYFGPFYLFGMNIGKWRFPAIITGFALNYGAYFAEIYRSGIVSMDRGQYEAAKLLGYSKGQTFVRIILPQVVKRDYAGQGYVAGLFHFLCGNVHDRKTDRGGQDHDGSVRRRRYFLLHL